MISIEKQSPSSLENLKASNTLNLTVSSFIDNSDSHGWGSSTSCDASSRTPLKQAKLLKIKEERGAISVSITLLALRISSLPLRVAKLDARLRRSYGLLASLGLKLPSSIPASSSSTSTPAQTSVPLPKPTLDKRKGVLIAKKKSSMPPKKKNEPLVGKRSLTPLVRLALILAFFSLQ
ncbi:hypothetical protein LWI28_021598 [Acer negundo]|uniref:Uncharacterized protein n=1 Tax=Acer negundo TaxID=4023 RepID=A0AAD5J0V4_ACENE|nr:hypothetical protein LWI28_021598 [Acer negundo]